MAGTPIICHSPIRRRRKIHGFDDSCSRYVLPLPKTSETRQLDSEEKNQPDEQQISDSPFQHQLCLQLQIHTTIA